MACARSETGSGWREGVREIMPGRTTMNGYRQVKHHQHADFENEERRHCEDRPLHIEVGEREDEYRTDQSPGDPAARSIEMRVIRNGGICIGTKRAKQRSLEEGIAAHHQPACLERC